MFKKIKKELKDMTISVPLYCIASFIAGAYTIFLVEYFCFDGHITPPGVSATIACLALAFTIYAAFKVKEWSETKLNEKGFEKCEEILNIITETKFEIITIEVHLRELFESNEKSFISLLQFKLKYSDVLDQFVKFEHKTSERLLHALYLETQLPMWNWQIPDEHKVEDLFNAVNDYITCVKACIELIEKNESIQHPTFLLKKEEADKNYKKASRYASRIFAKPFTEVFIENTTSTSKKVVK